MKTTSSSNNDIARAKRDVERAELLLSNRLEQAREAGDATVARVVHLVKPLLLGAVAVAGVAWLVSSLARPRRRARSGGSRTPSVLREVARAAALSLASAAARRVGDRFLTAPEAAQWKPPTRSVAPTASSH